MRYILSNDHRDLVDVPDIDSVRQWVNPAAPKTVSVRGSVVRDKRTGLTFKLREVR